MKKLHKVSEADLVAKVSEFLINEGFYVRHEVPNMGQSADIVATRNGWVFAIEAKIGNWRRAVEQCRAHELVADFVCIALNKKIESPQLIELLESQGYGLIVSSDQGHIEWIIKPIRNRKIWKPQRKVFMESMREIRYAS